VSVAALASALSVLALWPVLDFLVRVAQAPTCFSLYQCIRFLPG
jgi:hypothetical protein